MLFWHSISIAQHLMYVYNIPQCITMHEKKINVALTKAKTVGAIRHQHDTRVVFYLKYYQTNRKQDL